METKCTLKKTALRWCNI